MSVFGLKRASKSNEGWLSLDEWRLVAELVDAALAAGDTSLEQLSAEGPARKELSRHRDRLADLRARVDRNLPAEADPAPFRADPQRMHELAEEMGGWPAVNTAEHMNAAVDNLRWRAALEHRERQRRFEQA